MPLSCQIPGAQPGVLHLSPRAQGHLEADLATSSHTKGSSKITRVPSQATGQQRTEVSGLVSHTAKGPPKCLSQIQPSAGVPAMSANTGISHPSASSRAPAHQTELTSGPGSRNRTLPEPPSREAGGADAATNCQLTCPCSLFQN